MTCGDQVAPCFGIAKERISRYVERVRKPLFTVECLMFLGAWVLLGANAAWAEQTGAEENASASVTALGEASDASLRALKNARVLTLAIPAPRGQILDREGEPLAMNRVESMIALQFPQFESADREFVVTWARKRMEEARALYPALNQKTDEELWQHYRERRWLPLYLSSFVSGKVAQELAKQWGQRQDLVLFPVYARYYPHGSLAAHVIGYTGSSGKLGTGPINVNEPLWEMTEGKSGLELLYDKVLAGEPGVKRVLYNNDGVKLQEEMVKRPRPGGNVVTSLSLRWQKVAEGVMLKGCPRGAMVIVDVISGDVMVMVSRPSFDLGEFVGGIGNERFNQLNQDPAAPLFARAYSAQYPPASTFKAVVATAALQNGAVKMDELIDSPAFLEFPGHKIRNASGKAEGPLEVKRALARSCNTWFAQVGIRQGANAFLQTARLLGYGEKTGLPLVGEAAGLVPTNEWMLQNEKRRFLDGDAANMSIGQGVLLATPLQVAQGMAAIAHGKGVPRMQLIRQVQDRVGTVTFQSVPSLVREVDLRDEVVETVHQGMSDVVNQPYGTGGGAALEWTIVCGKTGTAQWGPPAKNQRLAWFAGFLPRDQPRYAYAVVYEGKPNQELSGGRMAAPLVHDVFEALREEIEELIAPPKRAQVVEDIASVDAIPLVAPRVPETDSSREGLLRAVPIAPTLPPVAPAVPPVEPATENEEPGDSVPAAREIIPEEN